MLTRVAPASAFAALAIALFGCGPGATVRAGAMIPPPGQPWGTWTEAATPQVVVRSPMPPERTRAIAAEVDQMLEMIRDVAFPDVKPTGRLLVVALADRGDYAKYVNGESVGMFVPSRGIDLDGRPMAFVCVCQSATGDVRAVMRHELTHYLISQTFGAVPRWLDEGLAQYFSTLTLREGYVYLGLLSGERGVTQGDHVARGFGSRLLLPIDQLPLPSELVGQVPPRSRVVDPRLATQAFYVSSFVLVHFLMNGPEDYRQRFRSYLDGLGQGIASGRAWKTAFSDVTAAQVDAEFVAHARAQNLILRRTEYAGDDPEVVTRALPPATIAATIAKMELRLGRPELAALALDRAIARHEEDVEVLSWKAEVEGLQKHWESADAFVARAHALAPTDNRPFVAEAALVVQRAGAGGKPDERKINAAIRAFEHRAETPFELALVSTLELAEGRAEDAVATGKRAFEADRACRPCAISYAAALERTHQYLEALEVEERVLNMSAHNQDPKAAARVAALRRWLGVHEPEPTEPSGPPAILRSTEAPPGP